MLVLGIDSSGAATRVALIDGDEQVTSREALGGSHHSRQVLLLVRDVLTDAGATLASLNRIAVVAGPGSFSGVRVGVATANGLGLGLGCPVTGVSTLAAMAMAIQLSDVANVSVILDARRSQVFVARFRCSRAAIQRLSDDMVLSRESAFDQVVEPADQLVVADSENPTELLVGRFGSSPTVHRARNLAVAAARRVAALAPDELMAAAAPHYVRGPHLYDTPLYDARAPSADSRQP